ncbi:maleylpyruvate isomerase N-terminal domain-containing protein [Amycolatopsis sp. 195334CR]|uniref:maleylpyruvate isomerase N-terminal domain-containing protein n=1 Tax=Amycolatopsis sp. 195334CR TaxID=2814588 RepID=UPI001A8F9581|nr:maleylpyruvate isomerase N-terminal domain-containing protein [Amycolatopsis sp. 195334CR]MBN6039835.1 maleylpyruvate isomerase N-terminal domain-containing protein [Amycolatopsis sp. 195334CR]
MDYHGRVDALARTWRDWAELGEGLSEAQWRLPSRCPGWDVAALYAHHSAMPRDLHAAEAPAGEPEGEVMTAVAALRRFNTEGGLAATAGPAVADEAVTDAAATGRHAMIERFTVLGPLVLDRLRAAGPEPRAVWRPGVVLPLSEAVRIVLLEATVHLLDVRRALGQAPDAPAGALADTAALLAEMASPVEFIEAAAGRSAVSPLPVLR